MGIPDGLGWLIVAAMQHKAAPNLVTNPAYMPLL